VSDFDALHSRRFDAVAAACAFDRLELKEGIFVRGRSPSALAMFQESCSGVYLPASPTTT
jgi:hypothetical protein